MQKANLYTDNSSLKASRDWGGEGDGVVEGPFGYTKDFFASSSASLLWGNEIYIISRGRIEAR